MGKWFRDLYRAVFLAGIILLLIGVYFILVKAGIPYQDPTPEMWISYAAWWRAGETNAQWGLALLLIGAVGPSLSRLLHSRKAHREAE